MTQTSTSVDKPARKRAPAAETRARLLAIARELFSRHGFDQIGVRELAARADVDPAIVIRVFGSKERLFAAVAEGMFSLDGPFRAPVSQLGRRIATMLMGEVGDRPGANEFTFLMHSATSPTAAPILSRALHARFVVPPRGFSAGARRRPAPRC